ncbi:unnamed protein product [Triticum turgidum subsp. durum]|uniref:diacylglycerol O-acyltransferase n=1 Tax=Triticum turgidum subsp. durum TaxID=4567 RepID=A0A9R1BRM1_TRITD|nr:unnamed protein product [Triticum turgidum subsp. durum]
MKYGLLIRAGFWFSARSLGDWPLLMCCLTLPIFPLAALMTEKWAQRKLIRDHVSILLHIIITTTVLIYPVVVILKVLHMAVLSMRKTLKAQLSTVLCISCWPQHFVTSQVIPGQHLLGKAGSLGSL